MTRRTRRQLAMGQASGQMSVAPVWAAAWAALAMLACTDESGSQTMALMNAWRQAELQPNMFQALDDASLHPGVCKHGKVSGIATVLCKYPDVAAARQARTAGLARIGETTGLALASGSFLLILSDPEQTDPAGRKLNQIVRVFRAANLAPAAPAAADARTADPGKPGTGASKDTGKDNGKDSDKGTDKDVQPGDTSKSGPAKSGGS